MTHGQIRTGLGGTAAAAVTQIGADLRLPAGGPWQVFGIWAQVVKRTTVPNEGTGGIIRLDAIAGDFTPDPAPADFPLIGSPISESANSAIAAVPLNIWNVDYRAEGNSLLSISYVNDLAITTASRVLAGIIYGNERPAERPGPFCATVQSSFASAAEQQVGTIILAEKATRLVGILADLNKGDAATAGEECAATIRLDSADMRLAPAAYPCNRAFNASDGTAVGQSATPQSQFIPVDIPVVGGASIDVFATTTISVTGNADVRVFLLYE